MPIKPLLTYPRHPEFEELLNSCGSMTKQLEDLGQELSVTLLQEGQEGPCFRRYTLLNLNNKPVVAACSSTLLNHQFFCQLLLNAATTPIGKFLFAPNSQVQRLNMHTKLLSQTHISLPALQHYLSGQNYQHKQSFWQRYSIFKHQAEKLELFEIMLPELDNFFTQNLICG